MGTERRPQYLLGKARETLILLSAEARGLYQRKALASLASLEFADRNYAAAREHFRAYVKAYPGSQWAWVASVRIGECDEELGQTAAAVASYRLTANAYAAFPVARVLGHAYAGRALEALGQFAEARREQQRALNAWDNDYGKEYGYRYSLFETTFPLPDQPSFVNTKRDLIKFDLADRVAQLTSSVAGAGGALLEQGRWLLLNGRHREAVAPLERLVAEHPRSPLIADARELMPRARLEAALSADDATAVRELEVLAKEPLDFGVLAAKLARAYAMWKRGDRADGEQAMTAALEEWEAHQRPLLVDRPRASLIQDLIEIRKVVLFPPSVRVKEGEVFARRFVITNPAILVRLEGAEDVRLRVISSVPGVNRVLFFTADQLAFLTQLTTRLGPKKPQFDHPWTPAEPSLWDTFFSRIGWGWRLETHPRITKIEFYDRQRTRAGAHVNRGSGGAAVLVEKEGNGWTMKRTLNSWDE